MPALFKSSCKEAASRIGVVSARKPKLFLITAMTYKEFLTVRIYIISLCLDDSFQLYLITIVYVQLSCIYYHKLSFAKLMAFRGRERLLLCMVTLNLPESAFGFFGLILSFMFQYLFSIT
jgi:hypothetical protein